MWLAPHNARGNSLVTINDGVRFNCSPLEDFNMSMRSRLLIALLATLLGSTAASAGLVTVTSYDMYNGNGTAQFGDYDYLDNKYSAGGGGNNGSSTAIPSNGPGGPGGQFLSGGTGLLTDGIIPTASYASNPSQWVGWKYQDPTITFHLEAGHLVSQISLYVTSSFLGILGYQGLVGAPGAVTVTGVGGTGYTVTSNIFGGAIYDANTPNAYATSNTDRIDLTFDKAISSSEAITIQLFRGELLKDGENYFYANYDPSNPIENANGFLANAYYTNKEPWIMLSEVEFTTAVPEPSTWIMMIIGFAGLGFGMYRRNVGRVPAVA
jgi:hypothetical protein